jgi:hypothetical protein
MDRCDTRDRVDPPSQLDERRMRDRLVHVEQDASDVRV